MHLGSPQLHSSALLQGQQRPCLRAFSTVLDRPHRRREHRNSGPQHIGHRFQWAEDQGSIGFVDSTTLQGHDTQTFGSERLLLSHPEVQASGDYRHASSQLGPTHDLSPQFLPVTTEERPQRTKNKERTPDYFANVGDAIRTLREDIPSLFYRDLNYGIYREDIVFSDPRNKLEGIKNYKVLFWSLRFHGKLFFSKIYVEIKRIWQPKDDLIKMRWTIHGVPRVPWEAEGLFDGISTYKLDNAGKVYEHNVDNVLLRDPPAAVVNPFNLVNLSLSQPQQQPCPGAWFLPLQWPYKPHDEAQDGPLGIPSALHATSSLAHTSSDDASSSDTDAALLAAWHAPVLATVPITTTNTHQSAALSVPADMTHVPGAHSDSASGSGRGVRRSTRRVGRVGSMGRSSFAGTIRTEADTATTVVLPDHLPRLSSLSADAVAAALRGGSYAAATDSGVATLPAAPAASAASATAAPWSVMPTWMRLRAALVASESLLGLSAAPGTHTDSNDGSGAASDACEGNWPAAGPSGA